MNHRSINADRHRVTLIIGYIYIYYFDIIRIIDIVINDTRLPFLPPRCSFSTVFKSTAEISGASYAKVEGINILGCISFFSFLFFSRNKYRRIRILYGEIVIASWKIARRFISPLLPHSKLRRRK